mgnify:FL=1
MTFKRQLMNINKKPRRIQRNEGGRKKNPIAKILRTPLFKSKIKNSSKIYSRKKLTKTSISE